MATDPITQPTTCLLILLPFVAKPPTNEGLKKQGRVLPNNLAPCKKF